MGINGVIRSRGQMKIKKIELKDFYDVRGYDDFFEYRRKSEVQMANIKILLNKINELIEVLNERF